VCPAGARTTSEAILTAGRELLEAGGLDAVTMQAVALKVGVRAPSLYKRFDGRAALIAAIGGAALEELAQRLAGLEASADARAGIRAVAEAYRRFARANPRTYELLFLNLPDPFRPPAAQNEEASRTLLLLAQRLGGAEDALEAARLLTAFAHGFVSMELNGAFRLGGDVDRAFDYGVAVLVDALARDQAPAAGRRGDATARADSPERAPRAATRAR
jgi:AcrR family transcriptional regulator